MVGDTRLSKKAGYIHDRLQVLGRLSAESCALLDALGASLHELTGLTAPIHCRATALTQAQRNISAANAAVDELLDNLDTSRRVQAVLEAGPGKDLDGFLDSLGQLERSNAYLMQHAGMAAVRAAVQHSQLLFNRALEQCDADFKASLAAGARAAAPPAAWLRSKLEVPITDASRGELCLELVPPGLLPKLRRMVGLMIAAQYAPAQQGYTALRERALQQALQELGLELQPAAAVALMSSEQLDKHIRAWHTQLRLITLLMLSEQRLAEAVWPEPVGRELFAALVQPHLAALAAAGQDIVQAHKAPEKVFSLLDMHRHLAASLPALQAMLAASSSMVPLLGQLQALLAAAAAAAAGLFAEYAESVARDGAKVLPMDGTVHPLTAQVLSYLKRLLGYENAAQVMYGDMQEREDNYIGDVSGWAAAAAAGDEAQQQPGSSGGGADGSSSPARRALAAGIARLLMQLQDNLEAKSRAYKNEAIAALFMMNNVHYVQWSVEGSAALGLLGGEWLERHKDAVEDWGARYHELTWLPIINMLKAEPPSDVSRLKLVLKETFAAFNAAIERIYTHQSGWTIPDAMLRGAVKRVIKDDLLGTYQAFMRRYADVQFTAHPAKYIKYAASDVASIIDDDLFETKAVSMSKLSLTKEKLGAIG
ncbi:hypothetical protein OEZ85_009200 [Tetradesmus obliquus]|uniref:Exocyst subunit Exo70 family protein n=1 Tax=Tetradesmus obliquus TaxID=3088 RepID=A0ABY8TLE9_TETOB|nr:hypothetical protein OEZ85_009200 [Tetradesmus obliquus]